MHSMIYRLLLLGLICTGLTNCTPIGAATTAGAVVGIGAAKDGGLKTSANDIRTKAHISDRWFKYDLETFSKLNATVNQGRVLLTGIVQDPEDRVEAVRLAWQVEGVEQVINEIQVADSEGVPGFVKDQWITAQLRTKLTLSKDVQSLNYTIDTVGGVVYLIGVAQNQDELQAAIDVARNISNVKRVVSYVRLDGEDLQKTSNE